jgi:hypothetical protein
VNKTSALKLRSRSCGKPANYFQLRKRDSLDARHIDAFDRGAGAAPQDEEIKNPPAGTFQS